MVNRCEGIGFGDTTRLDGAVNYPMIAAFHPARNFTLHVGEGFCQNGGTVFSGLSFDSSKSIRARGESF